MEILEVIHDRLAISVLIFMLICGAWGLWNFFRGLGVTGSYWGTLVIGEVLIAVEALVGVGLYLDGLRPARGTIHILYGIVMLLSLPAAFFYTRGRETRYESLIYAIVALFLAGVSIRARLTGGG